MADDNVVPERALVRAGWELVDLLGRFGEGESRKLLEARWETERARAAASLTPLKTTLGPRARSMYESPSNTTRFRRILDFVQPGERVFEIGPGRGYLAGMVMRDGGAAAYRGVDLTEANLSSTRQTLELNGGADRAQLGICDLYDLTLSQVEEFGPDLVVCCEVIEHVPDPERAVKTLAAALPAGAELLISIPLLGRLEGIWGHLSIFDAGRARSMVENSGLVVHAVDVVDNIWVFILASHNPEPSARAGRAAATAADVLAGALADEDTPRSIRPIALDAPDIGPGRWNKRLTRRHVGYADDGLVCELTAKRWLRSKGTPYGGVRFPVASPRGLRLELALDDIHGVTAFYLDAYAERKRVARWIWEPAAGKPKMSTATFVLRPGRHGRYFRPANLGALESADAFDLFAAIKPGSSVRFRITRASLIA